jgi:hypothetical protein
VNAEDSNQWCNSNDADTVDRFFGSLSMIGDYDGIETFSLVRPIHHPSPMTRHVRIADTWNDEKSMISLTLTDEKLHDVTKVSFPSTCDE